MQPRRRAVIDLEDLFDAVFYREKSVGFSSTFYLRMGEPDQTEVIIFAHKVGLDADTLLTKLAQACDQWAKAGAVEIDDAFLAKLDLVARGPV